MKLPENYVAGGRTRKATAMGGFGQGMLEKMGWRNGEGLGKERQGRAAPVEVTKKDDTKGLGGRFDWDWSHDYAASAFDNALAAIGGGNDSGDSSSSSSSSGSSSSDDECAARNADGTASSASAAELRLARDLAKGNNLGRFGGRAGKLARVREQEARLAAAASQPGPLQGKGAAAAPPVAAARQAAPQPRGLIITVRGEELKMPSKPPKAQPASWWGHAAFRSAGWLHGLQEELRAATAPRDRGFSEQTQVSLYNRLQAQQSKGRKGMGERAVKVMGSSWEGSKRVFDEGVAGGDPAAAACEEAADAPAEDAAGQDHARRARSGSKGGAVGVRSVGGGDGSAAQKREKTKKRRRACEHEAGGEVAVVATGESAPGEVRSVAKCARELLRGAKKQRLRREALEAQLCSELARSQSSVQRNLDRGIAKGAFVCKKSWVGLAT